MFDDFKNGFAKVGSLSGLPFFLYQRNNKRVITFNVY